VSDDLSARFRGQPRYDLGKFQIHPSTKSARPDQRGRVDVASRSLTSADGERKHRESSRLAIPRLINTNPRGRLRGRLDEENGVRCSFEAFVSRPMTRAPSRRG